MKHQFSIKTGETIKIGGIPVVLQQDTVIGTNTDLEHLGLIEPDQDQIHYVIPPLGAIGSNAFSDRQSSSTTH